jgi:hypothetical protein
VLCLHLQILLLPVKAPQNGEQFTKKCTSPTICLHWGSPPRFSSTLHGHLVDMYGAIKKSIQILSLNPAAPKCLLSYLEATDTKLEVYVGALFQLLISDKSKFMPKKRSGGVWR